MAVSSPLIVAIDFPERGAINQLVDQLDPSACRLKIGKELFTRFGPEIVKDFHGKGFEVFLDLKFHDIPNTVAAAVRAAADLGVWMVNVHASGGRSMMVAAREALAEYGNDAPLLTAVTVLTSMSSTDLPEVGVSRDADQQVSLLAGLAAQCGLDGVVCSAWEAATLRQQCGAAFALVTPGIRPAGSGRGDQQRVATPSEAMAKGSHYLVVGRPITRSDNPLAVVRAINQELQLNNNK